MISLKNIFIGACATLATALPSFASTGYTHSDLINLLDQNGIPVTINDAQECDGTVYGSYEFAGIARKMHLCPGASVDDIDLSTLRHETWHAIQHCVNVSRGTPVNTPVNPDLDELAEFVNTIIPSYEVEAIKASYPVNQWAIEFEANVSERVFDSSELAEIFLRTCTTR